MKLIFSKNANNEIDIKLQKGTITEDFSYIEMISQLLIENSFEDTDFGNLTIEEQAKVNTMLDKIKDVFKDSED